MLLDENVGPISFDLLVGIVLLAITPLSYSNPCLKALWDIAPSLSVLDLRGNPLRAARTYRGAAIRYFAVAMLHSRAPVPELALSDFDLFSWDLL